MSLAIIKSRALSGIQAPAISVEVHLTNGLPALSMVGLPEAAVRESKDRVRSAIINSNFEFPRRKITINLAPADLPKEGGRYDLAIALGILVASGQLPSTLIEPIEFLGELALSGALRPVHGVLPASLACTAEQHTLFVAHENAEEAALPKNAKIISANSLLEVCHHLSGQNDFSYQRLETNSSPSKKIKYSDLSEVKGQERAKRALEIAAAGAHNLLFIGPPGTGKTMLATRLPTILPPLNEQESIEVASIYSIHREQNIEKNWHLRPCRTPHHTASAIAMVGGGSHPKPGEISLAHHGVLFLDEFPEFDRKVLEVLREPLESGEIHIARASSQVSFPARFQLIAAMNPCPCGYYGCKSKHCTCSIEQIRRYRAKLSGPLLDRIDLHVEVPLIEANLLFETATTSQPKETSNHIQQRVIAARNMQLQRQDCSNSELGNSDFKQHGGLTEQARNLLISATESLNFSPRAYHRLLKVARSIADLTESSVISEHHMAEAISFRKIDILSK